MFNFNYVNIDNFDSSRLTDHTIYNYDRKTSTIGDILPQYSYGGKNSQLRIATKFMETKNLKWSCNIDGHNAKRIYLKLDNNSLLQKLESIKNNIYNNLIKTMHDNNEIEKIMLNHDLREPNIKFQMNIWTLFFNHNISKKFDGKEEYIGRELYPDIETKHKNLKRNCKSCNKFSKCECTMKRMMNYKKEIKLIFSPVIFYIKSKGNNGYSITVCFRTNIMESRYPNTNVSHINNHTDVKYICNIK